MNAAQAVIDLDDAEGLLGADREGLLRAASMAGAHVRAVAAALDEGALDSLRGDDRPRTVIWVAGGGPPRPPAPSLPRHRAVRRPRRS